MTEWPTRPHVPWHDSLRVAAPPVAAHGSGEDAAQRSGPVTRTLASLKGEAAALHARAAELEAACRSIEAELATVVTGSERARPARARQLRAAARETVALLEETVRRRVAVRTQIAEIEQAIAAATSAAAPPAPPEPAPPESARVSTEHTRPPVAPMQGLRPELPPGPAAEPPAFSAAPRLTDASERPTATPPPRIARQRLERLPAKRLPLLRRLRRIFRPQLALSTLLGAVAIVVLVLLTPLPELFGWQLFAVETGSMAPAIPVGSVVAVRPIRAEALEIGDVITFSDHTQPDVRVTHRIVSLETKDGQRTAVTKGDANNTTDSWTVPIDRVVGRVELHVPLAGYVMYWLGSPSVKLGALLMAAFMFFGPQLRPARPKADERGRGDGQRSGGEPAGEPEPSLEDLSREIEALLGRADTDAAPPSR